MLCIHSSRANTYFNCTIQDHVTHSRTAECICTVEMICFLNECKQQNRPRPKPACSALLPNFTASVEHAACASIISCHCEASLLLPSILEHVAHSQQRVKDGCPQTLKHLIE
eukprot:GHRR01028415.1.p1 GENE.GHRR01028415.1~~GHRR01028415.1.p1  ORF type:complete len:112 (-),score=13.64 GHRR01028415.1:253-588(-)